jgi:hypothetical protein
LEHSKCGIALQKKMQKNIYAIISYIIGKRNRKMQNRKKYGKKQENSA